MLPAQVGLPSVVVGIEPKLKNIHNLLPQGTLYSDGLNPDDIIEKTLIGLNNQNELSQQLLSDVKKQTTVANNFLKDINSWITKTPPQLIYAVNPIPGLIAAVFKKFKSIEYIYETLEIFCGLDYFPYSKKYRPIWYFLEKMTINNSLKSFTTDEFRVKFLRRLLKVKKDKIT
ncbi:hypothetical protein D3C71_1411100 [compost metagenome]